MHIVAKVFEFPITEDDILHECRRVIMPNEHADQNVKNSSLSKLIDRMLLFHEACESGCDATDDEYDNALMDIIDEFDSIENDSKNNTATAIALEYMIRSRISIKKYLKKLFSERMDISDDQLRSFYNQQKEIFMVSEEVRASHILLKGDDDSTLQKAIMLRKEMHNKDDFLRICPDSSDCPSCFKCGDLGFFPRGKLLKEIDEVAFSLDINEISQPFLTKHGYHILMVTDKRDTSVIPFPEIKDNLRARLIQLERDYQIVKIVTKLRTEYKDKIMVFDTHYTI